MPSFGLFSHTPKMSALSMYVASSRSLLVEEQGFARVIRLVSCDTMSRYVAAKESKMKRFFSLLLPIGMVLTLAIDLNAGNLETKGKAWLSSHGDAAAVNVNGAWHSKDWGTVVLNQAQGSRDLTGDGDGWDITGVVSGKQVFLLFSHKGKVNYSAQLTSESDNNLNGSYSRGFMDEKTKHKPMHLIKP
jgi:hypothetical protein